MKNFKLLFSSLLAILAVSILFSSCTQEEMLPDLREAVYLTEDAYDQGEDYVTKALSEASESMISKFQENYAIANALDELGAIGEVVENEPYGFHFSDVDLSKYLTNEEINEMDSFKSGPPCPCQPGTWCVGHWNSWGWSHDCH